MSKKLPAMQFYPGDWRKDPGVQSLPYKERGVWFEILLLMHESKERGKLLLNGLPMPEEALARLLGLDNQEVNQILGMLLTYGVASRDDAGALFSRRMVRDEEVRRMRAEAGKKGGNPALVKPRDNQEVNQQDNHSANQKSTLHLHLQFHLRKKTQTLRMRVFPRMF